MTKVEMRPVRRMLGPRSFAVQKKSQGDDIGRSLFMIRNLKIVKTESG